MRLDSKQRLDRVLGTWLLIPLRWMAQALGGVVRRDHDLRPAGEVVVIKMLGGGNLLIGLPALLGLRRRYPDRAFTLVCGGSVAPFGEMLGIFDRIERIDDGRGFFALAASGLRALVALQRRRVDTVVDLEVYSVLTSVFSLLTGARNRLGFYLENTYWRRNLHTHLVFFNRWTGTFHFHATVARMLGATPAGHDQCRRHLGERIDRLRTGAASAHAWLGEPFLTVGVGCSDFGSVRMMPVEEWVAMARRDGERLSGPRWVMLGTEADREASEAVGAAIARVIPEARFRYTNLCGALSLADSLDILRRSRRFLGIDSALLQVARTLGVPSTSVWGPTHPATRLVPIPGYEEEIHYRPPVCSPCLHVAESPPCQGRNICMRLFTADAPEPGQWYEDSQGRALRPEDLAAMKNGPDARPRTPDDPTHAR